MKLKDESVMVILSSPSGAGKTTLTKKIQQKYQNFKISVSHTTRKPRSNEVDGIDYFFISHEEFKKKILVLRKGKLSCCTMYVGGRIDDSTVFVDLKVNVRPCRAASRTY